MLTLRGVLTALCRNWREIVLRLVVRCTCGSRAVCLCAVPPAARFVLGISGGKFSNSGRTGLDLGLVMRRVEGTTTRSVLRRALLFISCRAFGRGC